MWTRRGKSSGAQKRLPMSREVVSLNQSAQTTDIGVYEFSHSNYLVATY